MMIDPSVLEIFPQSFPSRRYGNHYRAGFAYGEYVQFARKWLETKKQAERYAEKVQARWARLWTAKVAYLERKVEHAF